MYIPEAIDLSFRFYIFISFGTFELDQDISILSSLIDPTLYCQYILQSCQTTPNTKFDFLSTISIP